MSRIPRRVKRVLLPRGRRVEGIERLAAWCLEIAGDAHIQKDLSGIITSWDAEAERLFGYTAEEAIGQSIRMLIPADRLGEEDAILAALCADRAITRFHTVRQRKDGTLIPITLTIVPIHDTAGQVVGATKTARPRALWAHKSPKTWTHWRLVRRWLRRHPAESTELWKSVERRLWSTRP
jgi:PAS domain S-box-containing protein